MSATEALAAARLHNQIMPNVTYIEKSSQKPGQAPVKGFDEILAAGLQEKGHVVEWVPGMSGSVYHCESAGAEMLSTISQQNYTVFNQILQQVRTA